MNIVSCLHDFSLAKMYQNSRKIILTLFFLDIKILFKFQDAVLAICIFQNIGVYTPLIKLVSIIPVFSNEISVLLDGIYRIYRSLHTRMDLKKSFIREIGILHGILKNTLPVKNYITCLWIVTSSKIGRFVNCVIFIFFLWREETFTSFTANPGSRNKYNVSTC